MSTSDRQRRDEKIEAVRDAMSKLIDETNTMGYEEEVVQGIVEGLRVSHRTLQQNFMRSFVKAMKPYGEFKTDFRNEAAVALGKKIGELGEDSDNHLPFI